MADNSSHHEDEGGEMAQRKMVRLSNTQVTRGISYIVISKWGNFLCQDGQVRAQRFVGVGGYKLQVYKTEKGAAKAAERIGGGVVEEVLLVKRNG
jgi:flagellar hook assembly protein FlgD